MKRTHTPGPWGIAWDGLFHRYLVRNENGAFGSFQGWSADGVTTLAEDKANARLISRAPELLASLKAIMGGQLCGNVDLDAERFRTARALIAELEG
jgi:hypothetical protein